MENSQEIYACPECHSGHMKPVGAFLFVQRGGLPLCIPDFPAWVCDMCGLREYDHLALSELEVMLESNHRNVGRGQKRPILGDQEIGGRDADSGPRPKS